jgi:hypothetical protein
MQTYVIRYEVPGEFSQISEPVDAETPEDAAEAIIQRGTGPVGGLADQLDDDDRLIVHELGNGEDVTVGEVTPNQSRNR